MRLRRPVTMLAVLAAVGLHPLAIGNAVAAPRCDPGGPAVAFAGQVTPAQAKTYLVRPFEVGAGTTRVEVQYSWADKPLLGLVPLPSTPLTQTVFDLGLWDEDGYRSPDGFRGWSGSRGGRSRPIFVQQDIADRGYLPGPIEPGTWWVDLGVAAVGPTGATWRVTVRCLAPPVGAPFVSQPVDPTHVARAGPGWYHGDFHMHGYHSNANAPGWQQMVDMARARGLDFLPITDYVTTQHQRELGPVQDANPDVLIWPGREVITYFGHANVLGETPDVVEYRHGFEDVTLGQIQRDSVAAGALFQVNHPRHFPGPLFASFCRGCAFQLERGIDWSQVSTLEVVTGPILVASDDIGLPAIPVYIQNPFTELAIDLWESLLGQGYKITAVGSSDSKGVEDERRLWGTVATAVYASELSRPAIVEAVRAGHAYVRTRGAHASPEVEVTATTPDGQAGIVGDTLHGDQMWVTVHVRGGDGQLLYVTVDGVRSLLPVLVTGDDFTYDFVAPRLGGSGPLGTYYRVDTADFRSLTTIGNPVFLRP